MLVTQWNLLKILAGYIRGLRIVYTRFPLWGIYPEKRPKMQQRFMYIMVFTVLFLPPNRKVIA